LLRDLAQTVSNSNREGVVLFGAVVEKNASVYGEEAVRQATEQVCARFDTYLVRWFRERRQRERGLIVFAESHFSNRSKIWVREFRELGNRWGIINNLSDIPYFAPAKETRLLQLADFISNATFRLYEKNDASLIRPFVRRFDQKDGVLHGLVHVTGSREACETCECPACMSRREPHHFGPWI
jgi:hypothetical protein